MCVWIRLKTLLCTSRSHLLTRWEMFSGGNFYPLRTSLEWQMAHCCKWRHRQRSSQREIQESWHIGWEMDYTLLDSIWFLREQDDWLACLSHQFCWLMHTFFFFRSPSFVVAWKERDVWWKRNAKGSGLLSLSGTSSAGVSRLVICWTCRSSIINLPTPVAARCENPVFSFMEPWIECQWISWFGPTPVLFSIDTGSLKEVLRHGVKLPNVLKTKGDIAADTRLEINFPFTALIWVRWAGRLGLRLPVSPVLMSCTCRPGSAQPDLSSN